jgi:hypothetical protein
VVETPRRTPVAVVCLLLSGGVCGLIAGILRTQINNPNGMAFHSVERAVSRIALREAKGLGAMPARPGLGGRFGGRGPAELHRSAGRKLRKAAAADTDRGAGTFNSRAEQVGRTPSEIQ